MLNSLEHSTIEFFILILSIVFWVVYYIIQGRHDVAFVKEIKLLEHQLGQSDNSSVNEQVIRYELSWKYWDGLEKLLVKIILSILIYIITADFVFTLILFFISLFLRWLIHDLVVALGLNKGISHIGPDYIPTDRFLRKMREKGINQYVIKGIPLLILFTLAIVHIYRLG